MSAIVLALLPTDSDLCRLSDLQGSVEIFAAPNGFAAPTRISLASNKAGISIYSKYEYVVFKFECFGLEFGRSEAEDTQVVATIANWDAIDCLFRCEWERPALPNEVDASLEQVISSRGKLRDVDADATAIGLSMIGVAFREAESGVHRGALYLSDDEPATLRVSKEAAEIRSLVRNCDCVELAFAAEWQMSSREWLQKERKGNLTT